MKYSCKGCCALKIETIKPGRDNFINTDDGKVIMEMTSRTEVASCALGL